jgi:dienelactone hydrolase
LDVFTSIKGFTIPETGKGFGMIAGQTTKPICWAVLLFLLGFALRIHAALPIADPFQPFLRSIPQILEKVLEQEKGTGDSTLLIQEFIFASRDETNQIFAVSARPKSSGRLPGLLILHPGGSKAKDMQPIVERCASQGYAVMAFDLPGLCSLEGTSFSDGPWRNRGLQEENKFDVSEGPQSSVLFDSEVAALEGFNLWSSQSFIDSTQMGILGYSWGGYSATFLAGLLGDRVKAAYSLFGCGFTDQGSLWQNILDALPQEQKETWVEYFDAGRRLSGMRARFFIEAATNDDYFWPNAVSSTLHGVPSEKNMVWGANQNHRFIAISGAMQMAFFNHHLRNTEPGFSRISVSLQGQETSPPEPIPDGVLQQTFPMQFAGKPYVVQWQAEMSCPVRKLFLFYSDAEQTWQKRNWDSLEISVQDTQAISIPWPDSLRHHAIDFFLSAIDSRDFWVSSDMRRTSIPDQEFDKPVRVLGKPHRRRISPGHAFGRHRKGPNRNLDVLSLERVLGRTKPTPTR